MCNNLVIRFLGVESICLNRITFFPQPESFRARIAIWSCPRRIGFRLLQARSGLREGARFSQAELQPMSA